MFVMGLLGYILRLEIGLPELGLVVEDAGVVLPSGARILAAEGLVESLLESEEFDGHRLELAQAEELLGDTSLDAVLIFPEGYSRDLLSGSSASLEIVLEGSDAGQNERFPILISSLLSKSARGDRDISPQISINIRYIYAGEDYDLLDSFAPVYIAFFAFFFVFLLTGVSFLRERTQGTMERLLATPIARAEIVLGYMIGFGLFALIQSAVILFFTIFVVGIQHSGNLALVFLLLGILSIGAVNLGIFFSTYARTELQVIQFIPIVIIPQILLSGIIVPVEDLPQLLQAGAKLMPLTYANAAMIDVMIRGFGFAEVAGDLAILLAFAAGALLLAAATLRRQFI
jgi:ABC-2 type transport system permease protein